MLGVFLILSGLLHLCYLLMNYPSTKGLSYILLLSIFLTWMLGAGYLLFLYMFSKDSLFLYHVIGYLLFSGLISLPLKYLYYLYPDFVAKYNPFLMEDDGDFKVTN